MDTDTPRHLEVVVVGLEGLDNGEEFLRRVIEQARAQQLDLTIHSRVQPEEARVVLAQDCARSKLLEIVERMERMVVAESFPTETDDGNDEVELPPPPIVPAKQHQRFRNFQDNIHKGRPTARRQHAMIRPPRRGGR